jgi:hypothetical protein
MNNTVQASSGDIHVIGYDFLTPILHWIFGADGMIGGFALSGFLSWASFLWSFYAIIAYALSFFFLVLYIYASIQLDKLEDFMHDEMHAAEHAYAMQNGGGHATDRFTELQTHIESNNPNDWKLAIIEADILLDDLLKQRGYAGISLGDRLKSVSPSVLQSLDDAWQAHKVRNQIAHAGADFVLTQKIARETIMLYKRVFAELGEGEGDGHH